MSLSLSLSWTCQRDRVSLLVKFGLNKNNFIFKKNDNNVVSSREVNKKLKVSILYIYIYTLIIIIVIIEKMKKKRIICIFHNNKPPKKRLNYIFDS